MVGDAHQPLHDPIVNVTRQPAPFGFLGGDHLVGEPFRRLFPGRQLAVQPALVHSPGDEAADGGEQPDVTVTELPPVAGVHVEHADQAAGPGGHRDGGHGGVVAPAELGKVAVPGIGFLAGGDDHRLAVGGHPAADPLAQRQPDAADLPVERRGGAGQRERAAAVVQHVHEAHVGGRCVDDELGDTGSERAELRAGRDRLDDADEQRVLPLGVGQPQPVGHRKIPSRSAAATAPARSPTLSLR